MRRHGAAFRLVAAGRGQRHERRRLGGHLRRSRLRRTVETALRPHVSSPSGRWCIVDVYVTDVPEWAVCTTRMPCALEARIAGYAVELADVGAHVGIDRIKEIGSPADPCRRAGKSRHGRVRLRSAPHDQPSLCRRRSRCRSGRLWHRRREVLDRPIPPPESRRHQPPQHGCAGSRYRTVFTSSWRPSCRWMQLMTSNRLRAWGLPLGLNMRMRLLGCLCVSSPSSEKPIVALM